MDGDRSVGRLELQAIHQEIMDKLHRFIEFHPLDFRVHPVEARALVAEDRVSALL